MSVSLDIAIGAGSWDCSAIETLLIAVILLHCHSLLPFFHEDRSLFHNCVGMEGITAGPAARTIVRTADYSDFFFTENVILCRYRYK